MALLAEGDARGIEVETGVAGRLHRARDPRSTATVAAAHFEHVFALQINLRGDVMIKLDAGAVRLVSASSVKPTGGSVSKA
jgi:hypothetical protein